MFGPVRPRQDADVVHTVTPNVTSAAFKYMMDVTPPPSSSSSSSSSSSFDGRHLALEPEETEERYHLRSVHKASSQSEQKQPQLLLRLSALSFPVRQEIASADGR
ncbi:Hypothetical predicted protein [Scomber scombrus]|uniref:Uncharacterized protein n=1 Tax=Scomber scombrus TaxID=13677 RepID=A0AAV1Q3E6_SCOSC